MGSGVGTVSHDRPHAPRKRGRNHAITGVTVYFIPRIFYPGDSIYYPADSISLVYFIPRQDILSLNGDQGMSQNISVATQSSSPAVSQCSLNSSYEM